MQSSEGIPDATQEGPLPGQTLILDRINEGIDQCDDILAEIDQKVLAPVQAAIADALATGMLIDEAVISDIRTRIMSAEGVLVKKDCKLTGAIRDKIAAIYASAVPLGYEVPGLTDLGLTGVRKPHLPPMECPPCHSPLPPVGETPPPPPEQPPPECDRGKSYCDPRGTTAIHYFSPSGQDLGRVYDNWVNLCQGEQCPRGRWTHVRPGCTTYNSCVNAYAGQGYYYEWVSEPPQEPRLPPSVPRFPTRPPGEEPPPGIPPYIPPSQLVPPPPFEPPPFEPPPFRPPPPDEPPPPGLTCPPPVINLSCPPSPPCPPAPPCLPSQTPPPEAQTSCGDVYVFPVVNVDVPPPVVNMSCPPPVINVPPCPTIPPESGETPPPEIPPEPEMPLTVGETGNWFFLGADQLEETEIGKFYGTDLPNIDGYPTYTDMFNDLLGQPYLGRPLG